MLLLTDGGQIFTRINSLGMVPYWKKIVIPLGDISSSNGIIRFEERFVLNWLFLNSGIGIDELTVAEA
jgi:hypothetical protein